MKDKDNEKRRGERKDEEKRERKRTRERRATEREKWENTQKGKRSRHMNTMDDTNNR